MTTSEALQPTSLINMTEQDVDDFVHLREQLSPGNPMDHDTVSEYLRLAVHSPYSKVLVIRNEVGRIVSTATGSILYTPYGPKARVEDVVTDHEYRGRGLGTTIMKSMNDWFDKNNVKSTSLTSNESRQAAGRLYERLGYEQKDTRVFERRKNS